VTAAARRSAAARRRFSGLNAETTTTAAARMQQKGSSPGLEIRRLNRSELPKHTVELTRYLIGKVVVHELPQGRVSGRIVEAEAYPPGDPAGHHFRGPTPRIRSMYMAPGHAYVYFNYGAHFMLNVSSEPEGQAGGILIRALEPLDGIAIMQKNRGTGVKQPTGLELLDLTRGPGRLAAALKITREHDGIDLTSSQTLWLGELLPSKDLAKSKRFAARIGKTVRIGITRAADHLLRFYERGNSFVSGPKRLLAESANDARVRNGERKKRRAQR
jgi:DNA-3-methyladenine glycosylase